VGVARRVYWLNSPLSSAHRLQSTNQMTPVCKFSTGLSGGGGKVFKDPPTQDEHINPEGLGETVKPTDFQKKVLVWAKMYKTVDDVPDRVSAARMRKSRDLFRIRVNILMGLGTLLGCVLMIISGRRARDRGESLDAQGQAKLEEWARKGREERAEKQRKADEAALSK